ncbi:sensor domain-containing diguanylate cyclase [Vreelandella lionensis]|uniref:sensor domain-containing diguanylate cyclase n=1 Tax=Vreelandella lionensis TaxID=1144478 RepID=UPI00111BD491|nr:sensor domain-containing diguanylate cyclase [Halomonas lionensis]
MNDKQNALDHEASRLAALMDYHILDTPQEPAFDDIVEVASIICQAPVAVINFIDKDRQWFKSVKGLSVRETPLDISICSHAILQPGLFVVPDTTQDERFASNPLVTGDPFLRFYAGALLKSPDGYPLGTLCVLDYHPRDIDQQQRFALQALANQVMAHMELMRSHREQKRLIAELESARHEMANLAATDVLTGLLNRRAFERRLRSTLASIKRGASPAALVMLDIDNFNQINDMYGHPVGDSAIKCFAERCRSIVRQADVLARWGGEEFMLLMPHTTVDEAYQAASRLRQLLASQAMIADTTEPLYVTASMGICSLDEASNLQYRLRDVDQLLYQAKERGRDCIALEGPSPDLGSSA